MSDVQKSTEKKVKIVERKGMEEIRPIIQNLGGLALNQKNSVMRCQLVQENLVRYQLFTELESLQTIRQWEVHTLFFYFLGLLY